MAKQITKIELQKDDKQRFSIYLNHEYAFGVYEATLIKFGLLKGVELSQDRIQEIQKADYVHRAYNVALHFLSHQSRTEKEVRQRLKKEGLNAETIDQVVAKLKEQNYIDDELYAKSFTRNAIHYTRKGPKEVRRSLVTKGVDAHAIEHAINEYSLEHQFENACELAQKYLNRLNNVSPKQAQQKVQLFLLQKGYDANTVQETLPHLSFAKQEETELDTLTKQADKLLRRLERKYSGYEKKQKLKTVLYQKGFDSSDIERYVNEQLETE